MDKWNGTGNEVVRAINAGIHWCTNYEQEINSVNVFPVPDGDTGNNMISTLQSIRRKLSRADRSSAGRVFDEAASGSLMGAKGCSGIIVSLLFQGFAEKLRDKEVITMRDFAEAMKEASRKAWDGISNPVEGTILSVADAAVESADTSLKKNLYCLSPRT